MELEVRLLRVERGEVGDELARRGRKPAKRLPRKVLLLETSKGLRFRRSSSAS